MRPREGKPKEGFKHKGIVGGRKREEDEMEEEKVERERKREKREGSVQGGKKIVEGETSVREFL